MKKNVCWGCTERKIGCHGKDEEGNWRCRDWGKEQDGKEAERQHRREQYIANCYFADFRKALLKKEQSHHSFKRKE